MESEDFLAEITAAIFVNAPSILLVFYLSPKPTFDEVGCNVVLVIKIVIFIPVVAHTRV